MKLLATAATGFLLAGLAAAQVVPECPVSTSLKVTAKPAVAGRLASLRLAIKNNVTALSSLNVKVMLPSDCCVEKASVLPSLKKTSSPTPKDPIVVTQNVYWLSFPLAPKKSRSFNLKLRVSSRYTTAASLPIEASVYATNTAGVATCISDVKDTTVRGNTWMRSGHVLPCQHAWLTIRSESCTSANHTRQLRVVPARTKSRKLAAEEDRELWANTAVTCPRTNGTDTGNYWYAHGAPES